MEQRKVSPEAPEDAPFGLFAFPHERWRADLPPEPDTEIEKEVIAALMGHISAGGGGIGPPMGQHIIDVIKQCLTNGWYNRVFRYPQPGLIYRGMHVNIGWMKDNIEGFDGSTEGESTGSRLTYRSMGNLSSWSYNEHEAQRWARWGSEPSVILTARTGDNLGMFLDALQLYQQIPRASRYGSEREVVGLGDVRCSSIKWHLGSDDHG